MTTLLFTFFVIFWIFWWRHFYLHFLWFVEYFQRKLVENSRMMLDRVAAWLMLPRLASLLILLGHVLGVGKFALKGLSHEMDLPFSWHVGLVLGLNIGRGSNDFILQKVYITRLQQVYVDLIMLAAYFCHSCSSQVEHNTVLTKVDWLAASSALRVIVGAVLVVFLRLLRTICTILQPMGSMGRYLKKSTKPCWPIRSKETWTKYTPTTFLSQRKLALTAINTLFELEHHLSS